MTEMKWSGFFLLSYLLSTLESEEEKQKFIQIYQQNHICMERMAISILKNQHDAEDAVQNSFVQIIRSFEKVYEIPYEKLPFWILSIVKHEAFMILRKKKRVVLSEDWTIFCKKAEDTSSYQELIQLFAQLPETYRAALEMKLILGYTGKEIAHHLGISEDAANTRISRGRALLRNIVEKEGFHI